MMRKTEKGSAVRLFAFALTAIFLSVALLWLAIASIDQAGGGIKQSGAAPDRLASVGAPRSQLQLERAFSMMSSQYDSDGTVGIEPITAAYKQRLDERVADGERVALSVEEVLYIISSSVQIYESYGEVKLGDEIIKPIGELSRVDMPYNQAASVKVADILRIITYRIFALSSHDVIAEIEGGYVYTPQYSERELSTGKKFIISDSADIKISFVAEDGQQVRLYPTQKLDEDRRSTVICQSVREFSSAESELMAVFGYNSALCRNITPESWYSETSLRLFVVGGRMMILDAEGRRVSDPLESGSRMTSAAVLDGNADGIAEIYFTSYSQDDKTEFWKYDGGEVVCLDEARERQFAVYREGDTIALYRGARVESKKYITMMVRSGEPILTITKS